MKKGISRVQQMIMGAGKTTVVGPLLCLILADGDSLLMQVMPTALLEQTRNILRRCFSVIMVKPIYTLEFNRGVEDSVEFVSKLYAKLNDARTRTGIVCAAPESIKYQILFTLITY
jgi:ABC-type glutathione transport system ATPase component